MSFTTAVNVFAKQAVRRRAIPFEVSADARETADARMVDMARAPADRCPDDFARLAR